MVIREAKVVMILSEKGTIRSRVTIKRENDRKKTRNGSGRKKIANGAGVAVESEATGTSLPLLAAEVAAARATALRDTRVTSTEATHVTSTDATRPTNRRTGLALARLTDATGIDNP